MRSSRRMLIAALVVLAVGLSGCSGLPTTGAVNAGHPLSEAEVGLPDITQVAAGPIKGAGPEEIVEGFLDAAITPADSWAIARQFLTPALAETWRPSAGVTIEASDSTRTYNSSIADDDEEAMEDDVRVQLQQVASVDAGGTYTQLPDGPSTASFELARNEAGEWRITAAQDGIILDEETFLQVFRRYALQYYDQTWAHLVPDVRWYPRRQSIATTLTQTLLSGAPVDWLAPAVRTAFPGDVSLARDAVPVTPASQVAEVELNTAALGLDATTLARMRTQLESTLEPTGVEEVRFTVNGRDLNAGRAAVQQPAIESGALVLTADTFGYVVGDEMTALPGISEQIVELGSSVTAVDLAVDGERVAMQLDDGAVYTVSAGGVDELDSRAGLVRPSMDPFGYTWSVPASDPRSLIAWRADVADFPIVNAFPDASAISQIRVGPDGARLAAVLTVGGQRRVAVAAIVRDENGVPSELGQVRLLEQLPGPSAGLVWLGPETLGVLSENEGNRVLITQIVGGPATSSAAPDEAVSLAGARTASGVRVLDTAGVVFAQRGATWQESLSGVLVLATHAGH